MKLLVLDVEGTLAYGWDYENPVTVNGKEQYNMIVEEGVAEHIQEIQKLGCKVALATGVDAGALKAKQDTLQFYNEQLKKMGFR